MSKELIVASLYRFLAIVVIVVYGPVQLCKEIGNAFHYWWLWVRIEWESCESEIKKRREL